MYTKIKNTLSALTVALSIVAFGISVGEPVGTVQQDGTLAVAASLAAGPVAATESTPPTAATTTTRRSQGLKRHLAMPFISVSPLLPRRGV